MDRLKNKVVIITGAAGGMGAAEAKLFAQQGAKVMATDIQEEKLEQWVLQAKEEGLTIDYLKHDVTSETDWQLVVNKTIALYAKIDVLVNNAGIFPGFMDGEQTSKELWDKVIAINLTGPFLGCKACIPYLKKAGGGSIVNIASIAGLVGGNGVAYSSSKGGLRLLSKDLAVTLAKHKIRVNTICPGAVLTPMTENVLQLPGMDETIKNMSPQARVADAIEIAWGALYLASDESLFVTGTDITIDGGAVAR
ncbi:SDR family NAD(P)-dependent oxidoreductase [Ferruginibacter sp. SUN106]|uniref:SDR family NAD(P)-dependent oxidoreductase n=1 Tax=Ferruginibacter sp. SUN106 TaxID=2978348 RepID=UPI003D36C7B1